jgi:hypothetical protein
MRSTPCEIFHCDRKVFRVQVGDVCYHQWGAISVLVQLPFALCIRFASLKVPFWNPLLKLSGRVSSLLAYPHHYVWGQTKLVSIRCVWNGCRFIHKSIENDSQLFTDRCPVNSIFVQLFGSPFPRFYRNKEKFQLFKETIKNYIDMRWS